ncbi:MAG: leucyl aminopeptidase [Cyanothece sp. SIO2G6]|nr:leucyl aminopeptidase [Cyanothece sp. SIO2G6]
MELKGIATQQADWSGDGLLIGVFEAAPELTGGWSDLNPAIATTLTEIIAETEFTGKSGQQAIARTGSDTPVRKVGVIGLGKAADWSLEGLRQAAGAIAKLAHKSKCKTVGVSLPLWDDNAALSLQAMGEGMILALHKDLRFKSDAEAKAKDIPSITTVDFLGYPDQDAAIASAQAICDGVILARELVSAPANVVTPVTLAETVSAIAQDHNLELEILEREDCETLGMGSFLGVAQASDLPPKFIHLTYKPSGTPRRKLAIVGKGLTFDSGGLNLKVGNSSIEMMKMDMGGAAATFGAAKAIAQLQPDVEVHFISAATENMVSGRAMHPGDILTASNGKTIEVNNTDAEGRLTLADALVFADKLGVDAMVDLATLTGACIVALGDNIGGLWSGDDELSTAILTASEQAGEKFWRLPLEDRYFDGLKSVVADMKNTGPRAGGSITAALFLKQFVNDTPWCHLDIAGPVWTDKDNGYDSKGATGYPVRTLVNWVLA